MTSCRDEYFVFLNGISASQTISATLHFGGQQRKKSRQDAKKNKFSFNYNTLLSLIAFFPQGKKCLFPNCVNKFLLAFCHLVDSKTYVNVVIPD